MLQLRTKMSDLSQEIACSEPSTVQEDENLANRPNRTLPKCKRQTLDSPNRINVGLNGEEAQEFKK